MWRLLGGSGKPGVVSEHAESLPAGAACSGLQRHSDCTGNVEYLKMKLLLHVAEVCRANWRGESCTETMRKKNCSQRQQTTDPQRVSLHFS